MSLSKLQTFIYCAECEHIVKETISTVNWFELNFCAIKCLNKYQRKNTTKCFECNHQLTTQKIHVHKSPPAVGTVAVTPGIVSAQPILNTFCFCSSKCLKRFKNRMHFCKYCFAITPANQSCCCDRCQHLMRICQSKDVRVNGKCSQCNSIEDIVVWATIDGQKYSFCSNGCFQNFTRKKEVELGTSSDCQLLIEFN